MWAALDFTLKTALAIFSYIPCTGLCSSEHAPEAFHTKFGREKLCRQHPRTP